MILFPSSSAALFVAIVPAVEAEIWGCFPLTEGTTASISPVSVRTIFPLTSACPENIGPNFPPEEILAVPITMTSAPSCDAILAAAETFPARASV